MKINSTFILILGLIHWELAFVVATTQNDSTKANKSTVNEDDYMEYLGSLYKSVKDWWGLSRVIQRLSDSRSLEKADLLDDVPVASNSSIMTSPENYSPYSKKGLLSSSKKLLDPDAKYSGSYERALVLLEGRNWEDLKEVLLELANDPESEYKVPIQKLIVVGVQALLDLHFQYGACLAPWSIEGQPDLSLKAQVMRSILKMRAKATTTPSFKDVKDACRYVGITSKELCARTLIAGGYAGPIDSLLRSIRNKTPEVARKIASCHYSIVNGPKYAHIWISKAQKQQVDTQEKEAQFLHSLGEALEKVASWQEGQRPRKRVCPSSQYKLTINKILGRLRIYNSTIENAEKVFWVCIGAQYKSQAENALSALNNALSKISQGIPDPKLERIRGNIEEMKRIAKSTEEFLLTETMKPYSSNYQKIVEHLLNGDISSAETEHHKIMGQVRMKKNSQYQTLEMADDENSVRYASFLIDAYKNHAILDQRWSALSTKGWRNNWYLAQAVNSLANGENKFETFRNHPIPTELLNKIFFFSGRFDAAKESDTDDQYYILCRFCQLRMKQVCEPPMQGSSAVEALDQASRPNLCRSWEAAKGMKLIRDHNIEFSNNAKKVLDEVTGQGYLQPSLPGDSLALGRKPPAQVAVLSPIKNKPHVPKVTKRHRVGAASKGRRRKLEHSESSGSTEAFLLKSFAVEPSEGIRAQKGRKAHGPQGTEKIEAKETAKKTSKVVKEKHWAGKTEQPMAQDSQEPKWDTEKPTPPIGEPSVPKHDVSHQPDGTQEPLESERSAVEKEVVTEEAPESVPEKERSEERVVEEKSIVKDTEPQTSKLVTKKPPVTEEEEESNGKVDKVPSRNKALETQEESKLAPEPESEHSREKDQLAQPSTKVDPSLNKLPLLEEPPIMTMENCKKLTLTALKMSKRLFKSTAPGEKDDINVSLNIEDKPVKALLFIGANLNFLHHADKTYKIPQEALCDYSKVVNSIASFYLDGIPKYEMHREHAKKLIDTLKKLRTLVKEYDNRQFCEEMWNFQNP